MADGTVGELGNGTGVIGAGASGTGGLLVCRCGTRRKGSTVDSLKSKGTEKKKSPVVGAVVTLGTWGAAVLRPFGDRCWMVRQICVRAAEPKTQNVADMGRSMLRPTCRSRRFVLW